MYFTISLTARPWQKHKHDYYLNPQRKMEGAFTKQDQHVSSKSAYDFNTMVSISPGEEEQRG